MEDNELGVKIIKFVSGQEIIAKVISVGDKGIVVQSPLTIQPMRGNGGTESLNIGLLPFSWGGISSSVVLGRTHILCILNAEENLSTQYLAGLAGLSVPQTSSPKLTLV